MTRPERGSRSAGAGDSGRGREPRPKFSPIATPPTKSWPLPATVPAEELGEWSDFPARSLLEPGTEDGGQSPLPVVITRMPTPRMLFFFKMIQGWEGPRRPRSGDLVRVADRAGETLGYGLWNENSEIRVRMLQRGAVCPTPEFWRQRVREAVALRREVLDLDSVTNAYRVIHAEGDGLSGLVVDRYDDTLSVEIFSLGIFQRIGPLLQVLSEELGTRHARVKVDEWTAGAEGIPLRPDQLTQDSRRLPPRLNIHEHGVRYRVRFEGGHKTGFFCDQRDQRRELARFCKDRVVLDLCCYSGGFALNAAVRGHAREVTGVDLDEYAVALAKENANLNQTRLQWVHADAFVYLRQMAENQRMYGVVILDPPKLINSREEAAYGKRKYFDLNVLAFRRVEPNGILLTCSCSGLLPLEDFLSLLRAAAREAGRSARILQIAGAGGDHPVRLDALEGRYLKAVWIQVGEFLPTPSPMADPDPVFHADAGADSGEDHPGW